MKLPCCLAALLAQRNAVDEVALRMADGFRADRTRWDSIELLAMAAGAAGLAWLIWLLARRLDPEHRRAGTNSPWRLFFELCRAHRLSGNEVWLIWRLARRHRLRDPARLFLEPERFEPGEFGPALARHADRFQAIRARLFSGLFEPIAPSGGSEVTETVREPISDAHAG